MNDQDLKTVVRGGLDGVEMRIPAAQVMARGRVLRARRRSLLAVGAMSAVAAVAAVGMLAAAPHRTSAAASGGAGSAPGAAPGISASLTAWTVATGRHGLVKVTIRQVSDPRGLQARLRADGVRVVVTTSMGWPAACQEWRDGRYRMGGKVLRMASRTGLPSHSGTEFFLDPGQIPNDAVLWLGLSQAGRPSGVAGPPGPMSSGYLTATKSCLNS